MKLAILILLILFWIAVPVSVAFLLKKRFKRLAGVLFIVAGVAAAFQIVVWGDDYFGLAADRHQKVIQKALSDKMSGKIYGGNALRSLGLANEFNIIALSNIAEGAASRFSDGNLDRKTAVKLIEQTLKRGQKLLGRSIKNVVMEENCLFLAHLNIMMAAYQRVTGDKKYLGPNRRVSDYLACKTLSAPGFTPRSYANVNRRWPADQAAVLYSLFLFDRNNGTNLSDLPVKQWLDFMNSPKGLTAMGLHRSELTGKSWYSGLSRGCALSWTVRYMSAFAPGKARELWAAYKDCHKVSVIGLAGFREYPPGVDKGLGINALASLVRMAWQGASAENILMEFLKRHGAGTIGDSGPIFFGVGTAATALGIGGARSMADWLTYYQILSLTALVKGLIRVFPGDMGKAGAAISSDLLATALLYNGLTFDAWWKQALESAFKRIESQH